MHEYSIAIIRIVSECVYNTIFCDCWNQYYARIFHHFFFIFSSFRFCEWINGEFRQLKPRKPGYNANVIQSVRTPLPFALNRKKTRTFFRNIKEKKCEMVSERRLLLLIHTHIIYIFFSLSHIRPLDPYRPL